jgi:hypothetical protein
VDRILHRHRWRGLIFAGDSAKSLTKTDAETAFLRKGDVKEIAKTSQATDMPQPVQPAAIRTVDPPKG